MTPDDHSQTAVERLAQSLLMHVREDAALALRSAANDDDMLSRIAALPTLREVPNLPPVPWQAAEKASPAELEALVALALESAQDAEDISRAASLASRRARHGAMLAIAFSLLGVVIAAAGTIGIRMYSGADHQMAKIAGQVQAIGTLQQHISQQLAELHAHDVARVSAPEHGAASAALPPLKMVHVAVLPAHPAVPAQPQVMSDQSNADQSSRPTAPVAPAAAYQMGPPERPYAAPPAAVPTRPYHPVVVLPWQAVYVLGTLQQNMRALFR